MQTIGPGMTNLVDSAVQATVTAIKNAGGYGYGFVRKVVIFTGAANRGAVGIVPLFTVTGGVAIQMIPICTESLVCGAGATISVGTAAAVDAMEPVTDAVDLDAGDIWYNIAPADVLKGWVAVTSGLVWVIGDGADIQAEVLVDAISDGTIEFALWWSPITANGNVVAA